MIYPDVPLDVWMKKYGLEPVEEYQCPKCKELFYTTRPVLLRDSAGLIIPLHDCGPEYWHALLTPRTKESIAFWNQIV